MYEQLGEVVKPYLPTYGEFNWKPKPFIGEPGDEVFVPHENPEAPGTKIYLVAIIDSTHFFRHAEFLASQDYQKIKGWMFDRITHEMFLVMEEDSDEIYCIGFPMGTFAIFGKLVKNNIVYQKCFKAFTALASNLSVP